MSYQNFEYKDGSIDVDYINTEDGIVITKITEVGTSRDIPDSELDPKFLAEIIDDLTKDWNYDGRFD